MDIVTKAKKSCTAYHKPDPCKPGKEKHKTDAVYEAGIAHNIRFALPVYDDKTGKIARHNIYSASMLVRHANDGRKYLYDILAIKETSSPLE